MEIKKAFRHLQIQNAKNQALYHLTEEQVYTRTGASLQAELDTVNREVEEHCNLGGDYDFHIPIVDGIKERIEINRQQIRSARILKEGYQRRAEALRSFK